MIAIIRIKGQVGINKDITETLNRLNIKRKYHCIVLDNPGEEYLGMLRKVRDFVAYGNINEETYKMLKEKRGEMINGKLSKTFRLHPARGGISTKVHFPKGVLGDNKDKINDLIQRML